MRVRARVAGVALALAVAAALLPAGCSALFGDDSDLPPFVALGQDGALRIDIAAASGGVATLDEWDRVILSYGEHDLEFNFSGMSFTGPTLGPIQGYWPSEEPPLSISPMFRPGDGVASFFATVAAEPESPDVHYHLFLDTDWRDWLEGDLFIRSQELLDGRVVMKTAPLDLSEALGGVYHRDIVFTGAARYLPGTGPVVYVSNIPGDSMSFMGIYSSLDGFGPGNLVVSFGGGDCVGDPFVGAPGLAPDVRASLAPINESC